MDLDVRILLDWRKKKKKIRQKNNHKPVTALFKIQVQTYKQNYMITVVDMKKYFLIAGVSLFVLSLGLCVCGGG